MLLSYLFETLHILSNIYHNRLCRADDNNRSLIVACHFRLSVCYYSRALFQKCISLLQTEYQQKQAIDMRQILAQAARVFRALSYIKTSRTRNGRLVCARCFLAKFSTTLHSAVIINAYCVFRLSRLSLLRVECFQRVSELSDAC